MRWSRSSLCPCRPTVRIFVLLILRVTRSNTAHYVGVITYQQEPEETGVPGCSTRVMSGLKDCLYESNLQYPSPQLRRASDRAKALRSIPTFDFGFEEE